MSRGPRQQQQHGGPSNGQQNIRRGNKTLGWYLGGLMPAGGEDSNNNSNGNCAVDDVEENHQPIGNQRKASLEDHSRSSPKSVSNEDQPKRAPHMRQQRFNQALGRPRANSSASVTKKPSNSPMASNQQNSGQNLKGQQTPEFHRTGGKSANGKENYWYYDPVSDGYYYEHNGTRGWRKRTAKMDAAVQVAQMKGIEEAQRVAMEQQQQQKKLAAEAKGQQQPNVPSFLTAQQQMGKQQLAPANGVPFGSPMAIKYFDNDGYFYEMASVDGWKRRQPGTTPPNSLASSLGAQPKAPSPIPNVGPLPRRKIQPLQYQAYQQPPPQLNMNTFDMQEMVMLAQQQQQSRNGGANSCCCSASTPACCCTTIAALAAQLVLQKQQQLLGTMKENSEFGKPKPTDNVRPLIEGLSASKPTNGNIFAMESQLNTSTNMAQTQPANWQFPRAKWNQQLGSKAIGEEKKTNNTTSAITVGSFEEPYEFYWSGDEANSEAAPVKNGANTTTNTAASMSSIDDDGLEELANIEGVQQQTRRPSIAPIGSEAHQQSVMKGGEEKRTTKVQKRPESLRLTCSKSINSAIYEPISPGEIVRAEHPFGGKENTAQLQQQQYRQNFDVDKFIADLSPMPTNPEQILHSMRNPLRTPIGPPSVMMNEPSTADSPLFTPIYLGKNPWTYRPENPWAYP